MNGRIESEKSNVGQQTQAAAEELQAGAAEMTEHGREAAGRLAAALESARNRMQESTIASARATDRAIRDYPYPSLGIAFGVGILMGLLISRR